MSISCSDCFSNDLLCAEESNIIFSGGRDAIQEYSSDHESGSPDMEESITSLLKDEKDLAGLNSCSSLHPVDVSARAESVAWIFKVRRYYGFQSLTAYLSVNYFDRFLHSHQLPTMNGWPMQLLSVACLALAAKMEEPLVPSLLDLQVEGAKFVFEPYNIQRMELLVLRILDWRLRCISPFCYLSFLAQKVDPTGTYTKFLTWRAKKIILSTVQDTNCFIQYKPSCIAAAAVLCAANDLPIFSLITVRHAESWYDGLEKENITSCCQLIQQIFHSNQPNKQPKVLPQLRVVASISSNDSSSSSSPTSNKRQKLNSNSWAEDDDKKNCG